MIRPLPLLNGSFKIELNKANSKNNLLPIKCFDISKDKRSIFFWQLEDFNVSVIRDPKETKKQKGSDKEKFLDKNTGNVEKSLFDTK
jgi:hypothetical protein